MSVPWSQIHQKGQQQTTLTHQSSSSLPNPEFNDPIHGPGSIPRTYSQAPPSEGSEYTLEYGANHQHQYQPSSGTNVNRTSMLASAATNPHGRSGFMMRHPPSHQQTKSSYTSKPRPHASTLASHNPTSQDRKRCPSKVENYGTENPSTKTPQRSRQGTPNQSRRGSAISLSGGANHNIGLQCHYKDCKNVFGNDDEWRIHKTHSCRSRYYLQSGFQCSFVACPGPTRNGGNIDQVPPEATTAHVTYDSLADLLEHEKTDHEVLICADCHYTFLSGEAANVDEHRQVCASRVSGKHDHTSGVEMLGAGGYSESQHGDKFFRLWVPDLQHVLNNRIASEKGHFVNLEYPERLTERSGETTEQITANETSFSEATKSTNALMEPLRTAMANQLIGTLRLHNDFLTSASDVTLELTLQEKDEARRYLASMARLLRIELNTESSSTLDSRCNSCHLSAPTITVSSATNATARIGRNAADEMDPSRDQARSPFKPRGILSRSNSPSRQPNPPAAIPAQSSAKITEVPNAPQPNPPKSTINLIGTNTVVITTEEGEPLQEINISGDEQYTYFDQMMNCCLQAVYEWFERNREVLLENCECSILKAPLAGEPLQGAQTSEGHGNTTLTKSQRKKAKKVLATATAAASGHSTPPNTNNPPGDDPPTRVCLLHTVKGPESLSLPRWTHYLRRLVEQGRIPPSIISNKDSFSGEIQPVDEVRHAFNKQKLKADRDLLALVQQARKFCWQLKDWEKCRHFDELYGILEDKIKLAKEEENRDWEKAGGKRGSLRGRRGGQGRVGFGTGNDVKTTKEGAGVEGGSRGRRPTLHVRQSLTWPLRMLGSDE